MARRIQWISFFIIFLAISVCLATSSKSLKNNKSIKSNKKANLSLATSSKRNSDFIFLDDEDQLSVMLGDQAIESSGDGSPDVAPETPEEPEIPEEIVVTSKPVVATKKPHRPPVNTSLPDNYIPTEVCGKKYYCRRGQRGPCHRNEIFSSDSTSLWSSVPAISQHPTCAADALHNYGCVSSKKHYIKKYSSKGYCSVRYTHKPCYGYPASYRYCKRTRRCYPCQSSTNGSRRTMLYSPCASDQIFTAIDGIFGHCRCKQRNYVQCKLDHKCYPAFSKGPCSKGQWLVPTGNSGYSSCRSCPCPNMADGSHVYWNGPIGRPGCYKSHTRGPCRPGMYFVVENFMTGASRCVYSHKNTKRHQRPNLYSLLMDWPLFGSHSLLDDSFSSIDSPLLMSDPLDMDFGMGFGDDLFHDMLF